MTPDKLKLFTIIDLLAGAQDHYAEALAEFLELDPLPPDPVRFAMGTLGIMMGQVAGVLIEAAGSTVQEYDEWARANGKRDFSLREESSEDTA